VVADVSRLNSGLAIINVTDGVTDGRKESIVNEQVSDVNYREYMGDPGTDKPMCSSGGSPVKVPKLMQIILSMHAVLTVQWGC